MAHFAQIIDGIVAQVVVVNNDVLLDGGVESESKGAHFCTNLFGGHWIQTSINNRIRKQYGQVGFAYDSDANVFIAPQPFPSWTLDANHDWQPPTPMPTDGELYLWNEEELEWVEVL
jgi:hypothetical protein